MPRVSIALLTYNRSGMLERSINALLAQTYRDFELLICDNASTDETFEIVKKFTDPRITYIRRSTNGGSGMNWLEAVKRSAGEFFLATHDDDCAHPTLLEREMAVMDQYPEVLLVGTHGRTVNQDGSVIEELRNSTEKQDRVFNIGEYILAYQEEQFEILCPTFLMRRHGNGKTESLRDILVDPNPPKETTEDLPNGDVYLLCRVNTFAPIYWIQEPLIDYTIHPGQENLTINMAHTTYLLHKTVYQMCLDNNLVEILPRVHYNVLRFELLQNILKEQPFYDFLLKLKEKDLENPNSLPVVPDDRFKTLKGKRVAILGSLLNGVLLQSHLNFCGVEVAYFIDSNPQRQGKQLNGTEIHPFENLQKDPVDLVLVSCEKTPKERVLPWIRRYTEVPVRHWKEF